MRLWDIVLAEKVITSEGTWTEGTNMPKTAFPLGKSGFKVSSRWRWRVVQFECLDSRFRLLIHYRLDLSKCSVHLGREDGKDMTMQARYEWAPNDGGWHVHACEGCDDYRQAPGATKLHRRIPGYDMRHRRTDFGITNDESAFRVAASAFRLLGSPEKFKLS